MAESYFRNGTPHHGQAPDDHPHRCKAKSRYTGNRCRRFAMVGKTKCHVHGGRRELAPENIVKVKHLPRFYVGRLSKTLSAAVEEQLASSPHELLNLFEELAIVRSMTADALAMWDGVREQIANETDEEKRKKLQSVLPLVELSAKEALSFTREICEGGARIYAMCKDKLTPHNLQAAINQIVRIMHEECAGDPESQAVAERIERKIASKLRVIDVVKGVTSTPADLVAEMDATIPLEPGEETDGGEE